jgi:hypothetical protein
LKEEKVFIHGKLFAFEGVFKVFLLEKAADSISLCLYGRMFRSSKVARQLKVRLLKMSR